MRKILMCVMAAACLAAAAQTNIQVVFTDDGPVVLGEEGDTIDVESSPQRAAIAAIGQRYAAELNGPATRCFNSAPDEAFFLVDSLTRLDMVDYFYTLSGKESENAFHEPCRITRITPASIWLYTAPQVHCQLFVLNADSDSPIAAVITTLPLPMADSMVKFYDAATFAPLEGLFSPPLLSDWLLKPENRQKAEIAFPFITSSYSYDPETGALTVKCTMDEYFFGGAESEEMSLVKPQLTYVWNGSAFIPQE